MTRRRRASGGIYTNKRVMEIMKGRNMGGIGDNGDGEGWCSLTARGGAMTVTYGEGRKILHEVLHDRGSVREVLLQKNGDGKHFGAGLFTEMGKIHGSGA
jgi:hypothetical protein